jgi:NADH-quinone oxidoreductase subunit N
MLAYSSVAHSGYLLVAVVSRDAGSFAFYLVAYLFMNLGAFGVLAAVTGKDIEHTALDDFAGLGRRNPWLAAGLAIFLLSLAGFPPTAGFLAKFYVFAGAVREGHIALTVAAVLASLVSVAYYLKVIVVMYMREGDTDIVVERENPGLGLVLFLCLFGTLQLGVWPGNLLTLIRQAFSVAF